MPKSMPDHPLPKLGGSYIHEADGSYTPIEGPGLAAKIAAESAAEAAPETTAEFSAPDEETPE